MADRRADRRARLREACLDVIGEVGLSATTIDRICTEAGLTKRYFYEAFADLDELLAATLDEFVTSIREQMEPAILGFEDRLRRIHIVVAILIDVLSSDSRLARLYVECPGHPSLQRQRGAAVAAFTDFVATQVIADPSTPIVDAHRLLATRLVVAGTIDLVTSWLAGDIAADPTTLAEAIERLGRAV